MGRREAGLQSDIKRSLERLNGRRGTSGGGPPRCIIANILFAAPQEEAKAKEENYWNSMWQKGGSF